MSISSVSAIGGGYNYVPIPYTPPPTSTSSVTQLASGARVTTIRGSAGDILAVSTAPSAQQAPATSYNFAGQEQTSTFYVTA